MKFLAPGLILLILIPACTIQKRLYRPGWSVELRHRSGVESSGRQEASERSFLVKTADSANPETSAASFGQQPITDGLPGEISLLTPMVSKPNKTEQIELPEAHSHVKKAPKSVRKSGEPAELSPVEKRDNTRVVPIPVAILLTISLVFVSSLVVMGMSVLLTLSVEGALAILIVLAWSLACYFFSVFIMYIIFQLYSRKKTRFPSQTERNSRYWKMAFGFGAALAALLFVGAVLLFIGFYS